MRWLIRRQSLHALRMHRASRRIPLAIRLIALGKLGKGLLCLLGGLLLARLLHAPDLAAAVRDLLTVIHVDPDGLRAQHALAWVTGLPAGRLALVSVGLFAYAVVYGIEGLGLWFDRPWAEWLTAIGTGLFLPVEIVHLVDHPTPGIAVTLLLNMAAVAYLVWRIRSRIRTRQVTAKAGTPPT